MTISRFLAASLLTTAQVYAEQLECPAHEFGSGLNLAIEDGSYVLEDQRLNSVDAVMKKMKDYGNDCSILILPSSQDADIEQAKHLCQRLIESGRDTVIVDLPGPQGWTFYAPHTKICDPRELKGGAS